MVPLILTLLGLIGILSGCLARLSSPPSEGSPLQQLTLDPSEDFYADWSPDGQRIAIISDRSGTWNVWVIDSDGSNPQAFTSDHQATSPSWSPDGSIIAYATDRESGMRFWTDLWIMRSDGSHPEPLTQTPPMKDLLPSWSPDGRNITFLSLDMNAPPAWRVMLMHLQDREPKVITREGILFSRLAWSPDGKWIAFASKKTGNWDIWIIHPDGTGLKQVTTSPATDTLPDWSPDGQKIAFTSDRAGNQDIWAIEMSRE